MYKIKPQKRIHVTYTCPGRKRKLIVGVCQFSTVICCHEHVRKSFLTKTQNVAQFDEIISKEDFFPPAL